MCGVVRVSIGKRNMGLIKAIRKDTSRNLERGFPDLPSALDAHEMACGLQQFTRAGFYRVDPGIDGESFMELIDPPEENVDHTPVRQLDQPPDHRFQPGPFNAD